jgi:hypothetical protein
MIKDIELKKALIGIKPIKKIHLVKFKKLMIHLYINGVEDVPVSFAQLQNFFGGNFFRKVVKSVEDKYCDELFDIYFEPQTKNKDIDYGVTQLFHRLFIQTYRGNSYTNRVSTYSLTPLSLEIIESQLEKVTLSGDFFDKSDFRDEAIELGAYFCTKVTVDRDHLQQWLLKNQYQYKTTQTVPNHLTREQFYKRRRDYLLLEHIETTIDEKSQFEVEYKIIDSGRLYTTLSTNIQSINKEMRSVLLHGYIEYDIHSASPVFFYQEYERLFGYFEQFVTEKRKSEYKHIKRSSELLNDEKNHLEKYVRSPDDKNKIRQIIASIIVLGKPHMKINDQEALKKAKSILTMIFFGAKTNGLYSAVRENLCTNEYENLMNNVDFIRFLTDVEITMEFISWWLKQNYYNIKSKTLTVNGKALIFENRWSKDKALAFYYQTVESQVLGVMKEFYISKTENDQDYFLLHDCIYTKQPINNVALEEEIFKKTGYRFRIG